MASCALRSTLYALRSTLYALTLYAWSAYVLQHHLPFGTGHGFHPPNPVDIPLSEDKALDLAGLEVMAIRLPGHTYGSMGYAFTKEGRTYVATGDLIMPIPRPGGALGYSGSLDFSARDVLDSLRKLAALRPDEVLGGHGRGEPDTFIAKGIEAQDGPTMRAVEEIARAMSVSISLLADLLDPEAVIIGGPVTQWGTPMLELLRRYVAELADRSATREGPPRLEFTRLGDDVIAFGGAALVMERLFEAVGITVAS